MRVKFLAKGNNWNQNCDHEEDDIDESDKPFGQKMNVWSPTPSNTRVVVVVVVFFSLMPMQWLFYPTKGKYSNLKDTFSVSFFTRLFIADTCDSNIARLQ